MLLDSTNHIQRATFSIDDPLMKDHSIYIIMLDSHISESIKKCSQEAEVTLVHNIIHHQA